MMPDDAALVQMLRNSKITILLWEIREKAAAALEAQAAEIARWHELHRVIAEELDHDPATWPDHGNAPLAIAATFMLHKQATERAEQERATLRAEVKGLMAAIDAYLVANDPSGFGCACEPQTEGHPGFICGPCRAHIAQEPLYAAIDAALRERGEG